MKKIITLGASNSSTSINRQLVHYACECIDPAIKKIDLCLRDYSMPLFNIDMEKNVGCPKEPFDFLEHFKEFDGMVLSTAEHNRNICAEFKNILDWASRIELHFLKEKPILLMSTSPGGFGGQNARNALEVMIPIFKGQVAAKFSLPKFHDNFKDSRIINDTYDQQLKDAIEIFISSL